MVNVFVCNQQHSVRRREGVNRGSRPVTQGRPSVLKGFASHSGIGRLPKCVKQKGQIKRLHNLLLTVSEGETVPLCGA